MGLEKKIVEYYLWQNSKLRLNRGKLLPDEVLKKQLAEYGYVSRAPSFEELGKKDFSLAHQIQLKGVEVCNGRLSYSKGIETLGFQWK